MKRVLTTCGLGLAIFWGVPAAQAHDKWDLSSSFPDDASFSFNEIFHGSVQTHDIQGDAALRDKDWIRVVTKARHSYEARLSSASVYMGTVGCGGCMTFDRVNSAETILQAGSTLGGTPSNIHVRWIAGASTIEYLRVQQGGFPGTTNAFDQYDLHFFDTTYFAPRWNQSGSQNTVFLLQNTTDATVTGNIYFYNGAGTLLHTQAFSIAAYALFGFDTASAGALAGASGSAQIAQTGGYGALAGKAIQLEPSTGFTFDTLISPYPR